MTNGKRRDKNKHLFPFFDNINSSQRQNKKLVIQSITAYNMLPANSEIKRKITHSWNLPA